MPKKCVVGDGVEVKRYKKTEEMTKWIIEKCNRIVTIRTCELIVKILMNRCKDVKIMQFLELNYNFVAVKF